MTRRRGLTQKWERNIFSVASTPHQLLKAEDLHLKLAQLLRSHSHNNVAFDVAVSQESVSHKYLLRLHRSVIHNRIQYKPALLIPLLIPKGSGYEVWEWLDALCYLQVCWLDCDLAQQTLLFH